MANVIFIHDFYGAKFSHRTKKDLNIDENLFPAKLSLKALINRASYSIINPYIVRLAGNIPNKVKYFEQYLFDNF